MTGQDGNGITRRQFLIGGGAVLGAAGLLLSGCGEEGDAGSGGQGASGGKKTGGTLRVGITSDIDPASIPYRYAGGNNWVTYSVFETLVEYVDGLDPQPLLAKEWQLNDDATSLQLILRDGVTYHSGRPFTAADVKFNLDKIREKGVSSQFTALATNIESITINDDHSLTLKFSRPSPNIFDLLAMVPMADKEMLDRVKEGTLVGTGPFRFQEWQPKVGFQLQRNPEYWQDGKPYLDAIDAKVFPDAQALALNLESGDIEYTAALDGVDAKRFEDRDDIILEVQDESGSGQYIGLNTKKEPMTDPRVRQAINYALNRQRYLDEVLFYGKPYVLPWPTYSPAYDEDLASSVEFNLDKAKQLLAQAGYPNGIQGEIPVNLLATRQWAVRIGEILQADLEKIGVKIKLEPTEYATMLDQLSKGTFHPMWIGFGYGFAGLHPWSALQLAFAIGVRNSSNYDSEEYKTAVQGLATAVTESERKAAYERVNRAFLDGTFVLPFASSPNVNAMRRNVKGFATNLFRVRFEEMQLD